MTESNNDELTNKSVSAHPGFFRVIPSDEPLEEIGTSLEAHVYGQPRAMRVLASALLRSTSGMGFTTKPEFSGLFLGPPGVGKTETGKALAQIYHPKTDDWEKYLTVVDCANLADSGCVSKLVGPSAGYVGSGNPGLLLIKPDFFSPNAKTVVVFDEFEKSHPDIWRIMLSILDRGVLQMTAGSQQYSPDTQIIDTDWSNTSVIFTTNVGSKDMLDTKKGKNLGYQSTSGRSIERRAEDIQKAGLTAVKRHFAEIPEFLDRLDAIVVFDHLTAESYGKVLDKFVRQVNQAQRWGRNPLALTREAKDCLVALVPSDSGARGLRRIFEEKVITPVAALKFHLNKGVPIVAGFDDGEFIFWTSHISEQTSVKSTDLTQGAQAVAREQAR